MCQLSVNNEVESSHMDFIPVVQKRNVFSVSRSTATAKTPQYRGDLDMNKQRRIIATHRRKVLEESVAKDWMQTCASTADHTKFVVMLLGEAERYRRTNMKKADPTDLEEVAPSPTARLLKRCTTKMQTSSSDHYVGCLEEISSKRLFDCTSSATRSY